MPQKILFVEPSSPGLHIFTKFAIPRLGSLLLATIAQEKGYSCEIVIEDIRPLSLNALSEFDLVAISTITPTSPRAYAIADICRERNIPTIIGGPHATFCSEEALGHSDYVMRGEAEDAFAQFLDAFSSGGDVTGIPNLSFRNNGTIVHNPLLPCITDLDRLPHPDFRLIKGGMKNILKGTIIPVQTSRGCPYDCTFCSVTAMFGHKYRFFSTDYVIDELLRHNEKPGSFIFFYDDHFTANRKRTYELLEKMLANNIRMKWSAQVRADVARDRDLVRLMKRAGCQTLFIGFESINPESLTNMNKRQTMQEINNSIRILQENKIAIHGMFVFGFDEDTPETCRATIQFARKRNLDSVQFLLLTPFPGTHVYERFERENRILFRDWGLYDAHHVTFQPKNISTFDLQLMQIKGHKKFYSRIRLMRHLLTFKIEQSVINIYAHKLNKVWKKMNKPYIKLINLIHKSKGFRISANIQHIITIDDKQPTVKAVWRK